MASLDRIAWRLLPSETVLWHGRKTPGVPRDRGWVAVPLLVFALATVAALFAALMGLAGLPGMENAVLVAGYLVLFGTGLLLLPHYLLDGTEYVVTDRRVLSARGRLRRSMSRNAITYARIQWHRSVAGVGHLELVCATPFGPLARKQRVVLYDVERPDRVLAYIRGATPNEHADDPDLPLAERLDPEEDVQWGGAPQGWLLGWRDVLTGVLGLAVTALGVSYGHRVSAILLGLEEVGLPVRSWEWVLFFLAVAITWIVMVGVGAWLMWWGVGRARRLGRDTEYVLTEHRLLIRRGRTELSVDRSCIVDVADAPVRRGLHHLFLVLDTPVSRALVVSGALGALPPSRDRVPPVLYELRDVERLKELLAGPDAVSPSRSLPDAA